MATTPTRKTVYAVACTALAGALFIVGTGSADTPGDEPTAVACVPQKEEAQALSGLAAAGDPAHRALAEYLSRRFTIAVGPTGQMVEAAYRAALQVGLDPLLVLALIAVESRFNPIAESAMGAKGLMQIIPKYHLDKLEDLGGESAALDPESNILVGTRVLQEYVYRTGTLEAGLQFYNGAMSDGSAQFAQKVFTERDRIETALRAALRSDSSGHLVQPARTNSAAFIQ